MTLLDYIKPLDKAALDRLARRCATSSGHLKQVAYGNRRANAALAIALDRETGGKLLCEVIRPDIDWGYLRKGCSHNNERREGERRQGDRRAEAA